MIYRLLDKGIGYTTGIERKTQEEFIKAVRNFGLYPKEELQEMSRKDTEVNE